MNALSTPRQLQLTNCNVSRVRADSARRAQTALHRQRSGRGSLKRPNLELRSSNAHFPRPWTKRSTGARQAQIIKTDRKHYTISASPAQRRPVGPAGKRTQGAAGTSQHITSSLAGAGRGVPDTGVPVTTAAAADESFPACPHITSTPPGSQAPQSPLAPQCPSAITTPRPPLHSTSSAALHAVTSRQRRSASLGVEAGLLQQEGTLVVELPDALLELWSAPLVDQQAALGVQRLLQFGSQRVAQQSLGALQRLQLKMRTDGDQPGEPGSAQTPYRAQLI